MTKLEAFYHMVLSIAMLRALNEHRGDDLPAQALEAALDITPQEFAAALNEHDGEVASTALEFVTYTFGGGNIMAPHWYNPDKKRSNN